jgi:hypothetical protein
MITYKNGQEIIIDSLYIHNGEYWGGMTESHYVSYPGWIPMNHLLVVYIRDDFNAENQDKFYEYTGDIEAVLLSKRLVLWQWPGSDREKRVLDGGFENLVVDFVYKDNEGREWGYVRIGWREEWICLSEPENSRIFAFHPAPEPTKWSPDGIYEWVHIAPPDEKTKPPSEQYLLSHIAKVGTYQPNETFTDIDTSAWYYNSVATAYEYGIIDGKGNSKFDPTGTLTRGEALTIAATIHAYYKYGKEEGGDLLRIYNRTYHFNWYGWSYWWRGAVEYCRTEGLVEKNADEDELFGDFYHYHEAPITRAEMVRAWVKILEPKDMAKLNTVINLPDVSAETNYAESIFLFYEAGIVGGVDAQGTFKPDNEITRAEAATIFMNLIDVSRRHIYNRVYGN